MKSKTKKRSQQTDFVSVSFRDTYTFMWRSLLQLLPFVFLLIASNAWAVNTCQDVSFDLPSFEQKTAVLNSDVPVHYRHIPHAKRHAKTETLLGKTDDLLLGFSEYGHVYLVSEKVRLDGNILGKKSQVNSNSDVLDAGIIIRIHRPVLSSSQLRKFHETKGLTCSKTACTALANAAQIYIGKNHTSALSPHKMLTTILKDGLIDAQGKPVEYDIYYVGNQSLEVSYGQLKQRDSQIASELGVKTFMIVGGASITVTTLLNALGIL